ncbi:MAG: hypothetical protein H7338_11980 [Candidatus Sericytochromatia bacterium]|nr:hypothetical protein [Candidatus Sericytochromatia bacterium]
MQAAFKTIHVEAAKLGYGQKPALFLSDEEPDLATFPFTVFPGPRLNNTK